MDIKWITNFFSEIKNSLDNEDVRNSLEELCDHIKRTRKNGNTIFFAGNGASTTIASHGALDYMNQLAVPCIALNDPNMITCFSNDFGYENFMSRAIKLQAKEGDLVILISSSGKSKNTINAAIEAKSKGCKVVTFTGFGEDNPLKSNGDLNFWIDSARYNIVETVHMIWIVAACDMIVEEEKEFAGVHGRLLGTPNEKKLI
jgi:D-sedoheptulose 7-phosphate isomerase